MSEDRISESKDRTIRLALKIKPVEIPVPIPILWESIEVQSAWEILPILKEPAEEFNPHHPVKVIETAKGFLTLFIKEAPAKIGICQSLGSKSCESVVSGDNLPLIDGTGGKQEFAGFLRGNSCGFRNYFPEGRDPVIVSRSVDLGIKLPV